MPLPPAVQHGRAAAAGATTAAAANFAPELGASADSIYPDEEGQDTEAQAADAAAVRVQSGGAQVESSGDGGGAEIPIDGEKRPAGLCAHVAESAIYG